MLRTAVAILLITGAISVQAQHRSITVIGSRRDVRARALEEAIGFWNDELAKLGAATRFDPPRCIRDPGVSQSELAAMGENEQRMAVPAVLRDVDADVLIVFATEELPSLTIYPPLEMRAFTAMRTA